MQYQIADLVESLIPVIGDKTALVCGERRLSYKQLDARANQAAGALVAQEIGRGDHVGMYLHNNTEYLEASLATLKLRGVPINVNYRYVADELVYLFNDADLKAVFFQAEYATVLAAIKERIPQCRVFIKVGEGGDAAALAALGALEYDAAIAAQPEQRDYEPRSGDDLFVLYTGGTTGMPKGVMWRHEDLFFAALQGGNSGGDPIGHPEELADLAAAGGGAMTILPAAPFIHGTAQFAAWIALFSGGKVVIMPGRSYEPRRVAQLVAEEQVNVIALVGDAMVLPLIEVLEADPDAYDMSSLAVLSSSGAILSDSTLARLEAVLPGTMVLNNYGASETGHQGQAIPDDENADEDAKDHRSRFFMDKNTAVLDDRFQPVAPGSGQVGKIARKGHIPLGYYKDEAKTAATFFTVEGVRWVIPGDLGTVDDDGLITLLGRGSVCINTGGEKVYPEEVEAALKSHPAIRDVLVVGVADERWGQRVAAIVACEGSADPDAWDSHLRAKVAGYKVPREWHVVPKVERQPSGKPDYRWGKATAEAGVYRIGPAA